MKTASTAVDVRIWRLLLAGALICGLYFLQDIILPVAVAALITFVLSPVVSWLERGLGRTLSVILAAAVTFAILGAFTWICTVQIFDIASKLPTYRANLSAKVRAINSSDMGPFGKVAQMFQEIESEAAPPPSAKASATAAISRPLPVEVIEHPKQSIGKLFSSAGLVIAPLGSILVVVVLVIFMLFKRDDLRDRLIGLIGRGHIGETTRVMREAAERVNQFLLMNLIVNVTYGIPIGIGLYFIGVPSAALWASLAIVLRFIPYIGPLVAMAFPIGLSLAVFDNWTGPLLTIGLFVAVELISNNLIEPWLYGSSTGISTFALIVAALVWTFLWGPLGLILSTPLTVCLLVMGKNVPQLAFLSTVLSEESALAPHEMCYHRLLASDQTALYQIVEREMKDKMLEYVYSSTLLPALALVEDDFQRRALDPAQHESVLASIRELIDQMEATVTASLEARRTELDGDPAAPAWMPEIKVSLLCVPAETLADEAAAAMLAQAARAHGFEAEVLSSKLPIGETRLLVADKKPDWVWICAINPPGVARCRHLCSELHANDPDQRISIGLWHPQEHLVAGITGLKQAGAESVSSAFDETFIRLESLRESICEGFVPAPIPDNEATRVSALVELGLLGQGRDELFDRVTAELTKIFDVPIALVTLVDSGWQHFVSQCGLGSPLAEEGRTARDVSVCGHVVAANRPFVVEDLARDRRFAGNPLLREHKLRFYAGVPLRASSGLAVGSLCILDHRPRTVSEREIRLMQMIAENLMCDVEARGVKSTDVKN